MTALIKSTGSWTRLNLINPDHPASKPGGRFTIHGDDAHAAAELELAWMLDWKVLRLF
jgi:hypothetical protein